MHSIELVQPPDHRPNKVWHWALHAWSDPQVVTRKAELIYFIIYIVQRWQLPIFGTEIIDGGHLSSLAANLAQAA